MAKEAKLGLVLVGILLVVFSALLIKRLNRTGNAPLASLPASAAKSGASAAPPRTTLQAARPTLVTPQRDSGKVPEYAGATSDQQTSPWVDGAGRAVKPDAGQAASSTTTEGPPSLLATPL